MAGEEKVTEPPRVWTAREHAVRAGDLAAAIQPAEERFQAALDDPMERTKAIAMGAIKAHKAAIDHTLRVAELHARVADVLLRTQERSGSLCCGAPMTVRSDAGQGMSMSYGVCTACGRPADGHA